MHSAFTVEEIESKVRELGPWFHNLSLQGVHTAPNHFLGDYPSIKWKSFQAAIPQDLSGKTVLDVGCNGGFYSVEMKRRGAARVVGIDHDPDYLAQARFAAQVLDIDVTFEQLSVYEVGQLGETFDVVLFMGVFYHLRHPLLALDLLRKWVTRDWFVFQSLMRGSPETMAIAADYDFSEREIFNQAAYPKMHFVEKEYSHDPTNWWIPNRSCSEALLRNAGFLIVDSPESEVSICRIDPAAELHSLPELRYRHPK